MSVIYKQYEIAVKCIGILLFLKKQYDFIITIFKMIKNLSNAIRL